jgi:transcriptional regulator with XRE-family HTH domain
MTTIDPNVAKRIRMARAGAGNMSRGELASRVSAILDEIVSREIIRRIETEGRDVEATLLWAIAQATDESLDWLLEPLAKRDRDFRGPSSAIPGYLNPDTSNRSRIDHALGDCIGCAIDRNFHVIDEWNYHDPITGQIELILDLTGNLAEAV